MTETAGGVLSHCQKTIRALGALIFVCISAATATLATRAEAASDTLPVVVLTLLKKHKIPTHSLSVFVQDVTDTKPMLSIAADVPRNPASAIKLLTTAAALELLGPAYTWQTTALVTGALTDGRLAGDLYIRGGGDPFLVTERFWKFLLELKQSGLDHIEGNVVVDDNFFDLPIHDPGAFDGRPYRPYNVAPRATLVNFGATRFWLVPDLSRERVNIVTDPPSSTLIIDNEVKLTAGSCTSGLKELGFTVLSRKNGGHVKFYGSYPAACGRYALTRVVSDSTDHVLGVFASIWSSLGGSVSGRSVRGDTPVDARVLHTYLSPTVAEIIGTINKFSNNVMSRQLLLTMGADKFNPPGTLDKGREAISRWLAQAGLKFPELFVDNGAGLSRRTRISARSLGALLIAAHKSPLMPEFVSSLPLSAVDGTLQKRFKNSPMAWRVHLKTGTIDDVRAMGGYLLTKDGRTLVVVSLHNHKGIQFHSGTEIQNALLEWLYSR